MSPLLVYRASAGSGKTYTLVTTYIKWALRYPHAFKHILAVTFTNRATQEIKHRIIASLYSLSRGEKNPLLEELSQMGWNISQIQERSKRVLLLMVYQYNDFSVTTIDSFFHKLIQSFTNELGLKKNFSIEMDKEIVLQEVIEDLIISFPPSLQKWIEEFACIKLEAGKTWNIRKDLHHVGKVLFEDIFKLYEKKLLASFQHEDLFPSLLKALQSLQDTFEKKMQKIGRAALAVLEGEGLVFGDFSYGLQGIIGYFFNIANKKSFYPTKRALIGRNDLKSWFNPKKSPKVEKLTRTITHFLQPLLADALYLHENDGFYYRSATAIVRFIYSFGIISSLLKRLEAYKSIHNMLFISDISHLLYRVIQENDTPFFYERMGNLFHHFLIDEFQDLSYFQWANIKPLLRNSLAQGFANLLVGDVKQSIYRWRGGDWKLLNHEVEQEFKEVYRYTLHTNRRSAEKIVQFNNAFFSRASDYLMRYIEKELASISQDKYIKPLQQTLNQMKRVYVDVCQQAMSNPEKKLAGYVELFFLRHNQIQEDSNMVSWQMAAQKEMALWLQHFQQEEIPAQHIVVLVRNNKEADLITRWYSLNCSTICSYNLYSDYTFSIASYPAVRVLIYALYYLHNENNIINKVAWIHAYQCCMGKGSVTWHHYTLDNVFLARKNIDHLLPDSFWVHKNRLKDLAVFACVEFLIEILFGQNHPYRDLFTFFQNIIWDYSSKHDCSIRAFLSWWENRGKNIRLPDTSHENGIKVMTIHQAKGLEFNRVIIPFCNWSLDHAPQNGPILWGENVTKEPFNYFPVLPLGYNADLKETIYVKEYYVERMQAYLDNLNLLYVAFTRAKEQLYIMTPLPEKVDNLITVGDLIYQTWLSPSIESQNSQSTQQKFLTSAQEMSSGIKFIFN